MRRLILSVLWLGVFVTTTGLAAPIDDARLKGLTWLIQNQSGDGSWHGAPGLEVAETAAAVEALVNANVTKGDTYATGVAWLQNHQADSTDALARQAIALYKAGRDTSGLMTRLIALRNDTTLSWGAYDHYSGSFPDTSLAMDAIKTTNTTYANASNGIGFIANKQNTDGGWPYYKGDVGTPPSKVIPTAHNLLTLNRYKAVYGVQSYINSGITWLKAQQKIPSGSFGEGTGTILETALAYRALVAELGSADTAAINAQSFLIAQQQANGSWGANDALLTTLTLAAFPAVTLPDTDKDGLPDGVVQSLLKVHQQPGNPVSQQLRQHLEEVAELIDEAEYEDRLQQTGEASLLESKRTEIADLRQEVEGQLDQMRTKLAGLKLIDKVKAFDQYAGQVKQRFDCIDHSLVY